MNYLGLMQGTKSQTAALAHKLPAALRAEVEKHHEYAEGVLEILSYELEKVNSNQHLNPAGKLEARRAATAKARESLQTLDRAVERYKAEVADIIAKGSAKLAPENPVLDFLRQREIRDKIVNDAVLEMTYKSATKTGANMALVDALENAPIPYEFVTADTRAESMQTRFKMHSPALAEHVAGLNTAVVCVGQGSLAMAQQIVNQHS